MRLSPIEPGKLGEALRALATLGMAGCNLTIPHKETALKLVDVVEAGAARIGAINCVVVGEDGRLTGKNYDGFGFIAALRASRAGLGRQGRARRRHRRRRRRPRDRGGAPRRGRNGNPRLQPHARAGAGAGQRTSAPRSRRMPGRIAIRASRARGCSSTRRARAWSASRHSRSTLPRCRLRPWSATSSMRRWRRRCSRARAAPASSRSTGSGMLIHQARPAFRDWFGVMPEATAELRALIVATL